jgi:hypothetical protein
MQINPQAPLDASEQIVVVVTPSWTSTTGTMQRFERATPASEWRSLESAVPVVVGRTGIAWGVGFDSVSTHTSTKATERRQPEFFPSTRRSVLRRAIRCRV